MIYVLTALVVLGEFFMLVEFGSILMKIKELSISLLELKKKYADLDEKLDNGIIDVLNDTTQLIGFTQDVDLELTNQVLHEFMDSNAKKKKTTKKKKSRSDLEGQNEFYDIQE